ncbi:MAG TPA: phosphatase PAP2 family protein [Baekduia sp.]|nr:phosphatase PAP2 family protein [Baekduia sp.]
MQAVDLRLLRWMRTLPHAPLGDRLLRWSSQATDHGHGWVALTAAGALIDRRRRWRWLRALAVLAGTERAGRAIKHVTGRRRPRLAGLRPLAPTPGPLSFPSSHTANAVAAALVLPPLLPAAPLWAFAGITAASRPYLGVHYPSDVVAGWALGEALGRLARCAAGVDRRSVDRFACPGGELTRAVARRTSSYETSRRLREHPERPHVAQIGKADRGDLGLRRHDARDVLEDDTPRTLLSSF